jgi:hypothetical protein
LALQVYAGGAYVFSAPPRHHILIEARFGPKAGNRGGGWIVRYVPKARMASSGLLRIKYHDSTQVLASLKVGIAAIYLVEAIGLTDEFAQLQHAIAI